MALAIEPMITRGERHVAELDDGWTVITTDGSRAAHFEHTVAITPEGPWVLTAREEEKDNKQIIPNDFGLLASVPPSLSPTAGTMPGDPRLRASDADRERTAQLLREHHAVGRLTAEEFNDRLEKAFGARTLGELDELLADLPAIDLYELPSAGIRPTRRGGSGPQAARRRCGAAVARRHLGRLGAGSALLVVVWVVIAIQVGGLAWVPWFALIIAPVGAWPGDQVAEP